LALLGSAVAVLVAASVLQADPAQRGGNFITDIRIAIGSYKDEQLALSTEPCRDGSKRESEILESYLLQSIVDGKISDLQQRLRKDLDALAMINAGPKCGHRQDGLWILTEDDTADRLVKVNPSLVPALRPGERRETDPVVVAKALRASRPRSDESPTVNGSFGVMAAPLRLKDAIVDVFHLRRFRSALEVDRRHGYGIPEGPEWSLAPEWTAAERARINLRSVEAANIAIDEATKFLEQAMARRARELRSTFRFLWYVFLGAGLVVALVFLGGRFLVALRDRRGKRVVDAASTADELCAVIGVAQYGERVRAFAIDRLDALVLESEAQLMAIEKTLECLESVPDIVERRLSVRLAEVIHAQANRLRHRVPKGRSTRQGAAHRPERQKGLDLLPAKVQ
jgi:hypothetical protein